MIGVLVLCAVLAALGCGLLLRLGEESARRYGDFMPQPGAWWASSASPQE